MITSKLTSKAQTTIPQPVRHHLGVKEGDLLGFIIDGDKVLLTRPVSGSAEHGSVFAEWESEADQRSFYGL